LHLTYVLLDKPKPCEFVAMHVSKWINCQCEKW